MKIGAVQNNMLGYSQIRFGNSKREAAERAVAAARERWESTSRALDDYRHSCGGDVKALLNSNEFALLKIENSEAYRAYSNLEHGCYGAGLIDIPNVDCSD